MGRVGTVLRWQVGLADLIKQFVLALGSRREFYHKKFHWAGVTAIVGVYDLIAFLEFSGAVISEAIRRTHELHTSG